MKRVKGKSVFGGVAIGKILVYDKKQKQIERYHIEEEEAELARFEDAKQKAVKQLKDLYEKALVKIGETNAMIFEVHQMMLEDLDYNESILNIIKTQQVNCEYAIGITSDNFAQMFSSMDDDYMKERAADVKDISERLLCVLSGDKDADMVSSEPVIILADDLAPSETVQLDKEKVLALVTRQGSGNSHTAILARTMNIPAIIGADIEIDSKYNGVQAVVNGFTGEFLIEPDENTLSEMETKRQEEFHKRELLQQMKGRENVTKDGQKIKLYANIGSVTDVANALKNDAGGIGLFRSEFLYLESKDYPTEEEQFQVYRKVAETMHGRKVIIRTLDIGADKQIDYFNMEKEENPALGYRAIRICLDRTEIFKTQLRALYRASAYGNLAIMYPMIISLEEIRQIKAMAELVKRELKEENIPFSEKVETGIMIETPAAALISDLLAKEVDFFSIGTNDLTQYTLAIDRQNPKLDSIYDAHHLAVLRMLKMIADNAHANGIWAGICGELGADLELIETFLSIGMDELSVSPAMILPIRQKVRETNVSAVREQVLQRLMQ